MTTWNIRPIQVPDDFERIAELMSANIPEPTTVAELAEQEAKPNGFQYRVLAVDDAGRAAGYGFVRRYPFEKSGVWFLKVYVDPANWGQGAGRAIYAAMDAFVQAQDGVVEYESFVRDAAASSIAWVQRRGFEIRRHIFESTLTLDTFDESPYAGTIERVEAAGIRFMTLAEETSEAAERKLHELFSRLAPDIPGYHLAEYPQFEQWRQWVFESRSTLREGMIVALDGDRFIGATTLIRIEGGGGLYTDFTCVDRAYRGRGIALALKLLSIRVARQLGAPYMRTNNDSLNAPMLAINRKLGYQPEPGMYLVSRRFGSHQEA